MNFHALIQNVLDETQHSALPAFGPELAICGTILALLLWKILDPEQSLHAFWIMLAGSVTALWLAAPWRLSGAELPASVQIFGGLLVYDTFSIYVRALLLWFLVLFAIFTRLSGVPGRGDAAEIYVLVLGAGLGMCLMTAANHMLIVFLAVEMASVPSYALAGMLRHRRESSEAALKFAVYGAGTAGVMLYGISLLVGVLGTAHLPTMAVQLGELLQHGGGPREMVLMLGGLMLLVGVAFKLSAFPFHFWAPDVFEGATAEVASFLSVASKAAALALLVRLALGLGASADPALLAALAPARHFILGLVALLAAVTCTFGNLAAYGQTNIKRLLAYSTIAHAGYMMMAVAAAVALSGSDPAGSRRAVAALGFYLGVYLFMNLGAFAFVAFWRNRTGSEQIESYRGLLRRSPGAGLCLAIILVSLIGLPPLAGFTAKFTVFAALLDAKLLALLVIGGLNTVLSLWYYLRIVWIMTQEGEARPEEMPLASPGGLYFLALTVPLVLLFVWSNGLLSWAEAAAQRLM